jgi:hypothetical protein
MVGMPNPDDAPAPKKNVVFSALDPKVFPTRVTVGL